MSSKHRNILAAGRYQDVNIQGVPQAVLVRLYRFMVRLRMVEERIAQEYHPADEMACPIHLCVGQEAGAAALSEVLTHDDWMFSHHRGHGYYLAKDAPLKLLLAELYGKATGANGGLAGSQDISLDEARFYGGAILAGSVGIAVGTAMAIKLKRRPGLAVAGFGEGATDEGIFWEAVNYAALKKLPVVFFCENNRYATYSPQSNRQPEDNLSEKVATFGVPSRDVFGNDVVAIYRMLVEIAGAVRTGAGPFFLQTYTYRMSSHVGPEDDSYVQYRSTEEREFWKQNCPIALLEEKMMAAAALTPTTKEAIVQAINSEITEALSFAKESPFPVARDWGPMNEAETSPLADRLLAEEREHDFDGQQHEALPGPY